VDLIAEDLFVGLFGDTTSQPTPIERIATIIAMPIQPRGLIDVRAILILAQRRALPPGENVVVEWKLWS
jgi:hypothetical protein